MAYFFIHPVHPVYGLLRVKKPSESHYHTYIMKPSMSQLRRHACSPKTGTCQQYDFRKKYQLSAAIINID